MYRRLAAHASRFSSFLHSLCWFLRVLHTNHARWADLELFLFWVAYGHWMNETCRISDNIIKYSTAFDWFYMEKVNYLNAPPSPCLAPKPPNGEKKSVSVSKSNTFFSNRLSDISKNEANGLLEPKNWANVALGSPWNWYEKLFAVLLPFDPPVTRDKREK